MPILLKPGSLNLLEPPGPVQELLATPYFESFFTFPRHIRTVGVQRNTRRPPSPTCILKSLTYVFKTASLINLGINPMHFLLSLLQLAQSSPLALRPSATGFRHR